MAKLTVPNYAVRIKESQSQFHLMRNMTRTALAKSVITICQETLWPGKGYTLEVKPIGKIKAENLCSICLGAMTADDE